MIFIETPVFTRLVKELLDDDAYADFQRFLAAHPTAGDVIKDTGGLRKIGSPVAAVASGVARERSTTTSPRTLASPCC